MSLFSTAEARAFVLKGQTPLSSTDQFPDAAITSAAARIKAAFEDICLVALEPVTGVVHRFNGDDRPVVWVPHFEVTAVTAADNNGTALDAAQLAQLDIDPWGRISYDGGRWSANPFVSRNCSVTYTHGLASVPADIKWAALIVCIEELQGQSVTGRAIAQTNELGTVRLSTADGINRWYGIPAVDAVLRRYEDKYRRII